jgi:hypothetical protein
VPASPRAVLRSAQPARFPRTPPLPRVRTLSTPSAMIMTRTEAVTEISLKFALLAARPVRRGREHVLLTEISACEARACRARHSRDSTAGCRLLRPRCALHGDGRHGLPPVRGRHLLCGGRSLSAVRCPVRGGPARESFLRVHWVAVPQALRARRVDRRRHRAPPAATASAASARATSTATAWRAMRGGSAAAATACCARRPARRIVSVSAAQPVRR